MAIVPGTHRAAVHPAALRPVTRTPRPVPVTHARRGSSAWHWLWGAVALAVGLFIAGAGWIAWMPGPVVVTVGLVSLVTRRSWSLPALWVGLGLTLGVVLHLVLHVLRTA